ncbi:14342_t:CDS:2 [Acaulospora colombiana]|uniref:14342_t:CDS:1 n=1 Tax=Acaulospora colombiana TaxID=27376 RepID=A0ACA9JVG4_9GLOM|nr:14342_t:CDS:2 [Acaulospora colombiana]
MLKFQATDLYIVWNVEILLFWEMPLRRARMTPEQLMTARIMMSSPCNLKKVVLATPEINSVTPSLLNGIKIIMPKLSNSPSIDTPVIIK